MVAKDDIFLLKNSLWTSWRDTMHFRHRYQKVDSLELRQMLGEVSSAEVNDCAQNVSGASYQLSRANNEPAKITAISTVPLFGYLGLGAVMGTYGFAVKGYSFLWLAASIIPGALYYKVAMSNQNETLIQNCYRYIIAKRAATCQYEANKAAFESNEVTQSEGYKKMQEGMRTSSKTMYDVEHDLVQRISNGTF
jgi:hypothetical protein